MSNNIFKVVLLTALPASGKSELRKFLANVEPKQLEKDFHIGRNLQLDDFPYVNFMRCVDNALEAIGEPRIFYSADDDIYFTTYDYGTLCHLLNEDYHDLFVGKKVECESYTKYLFERIDKAAKNCGIEPRLSKLSSKVIDRIEPKLEAEAKYVVDFKESQYCEDMSDKTIIIEFSRGGTDGSTMPLSGPFGYQYALKQFSDEILSQCAILYIYVTPEESRRKNFERADPNDPGSNMNHGVPLNVMLKDYGTDDMLYLIEQSDKENTVKVETHDKEYHLPIGVFDNRNDLTTFLRQDVSEWGKEEVSQMYEMVIEVTDQMFEGYE